MISELELPRIGGIMTMDSELKKVLRKVPKKTKKTRGRGHGGARRGITTIDLLF